MSSLDAAVGPDQRGTSNSQGPNPLHYLRRHGGASASTMYDPIPTLNPAEFGSYESCFAARVGGIRATRGWSRFEITGHFAETDEDEGGGEESVTTDKIGHFVNLSTDSLRELQTGLWGGRVWEEMCEVAVFTANKTGAAAHGLKLKPLSAVARAVVGKLTAGDGTRRDEGAATNLGDGLEGEAQSGAAEQDIPGAQGGETKRSPYSVAMRAPGNPALLPARTARGATGKDPRPQHRTAQATSTRRPRRAPPRRVARRRCSNPRPATA